MLLSAHGKFNLFCFTELSSTAYQMTEFGPQHYSEFFCVVSNSECHKESAIGRDGKSNGIENRNKAKSSI